MNRFSSFSRFSSSLIFFVMVFILGFFAPSAQAINYIPRVHFEFVDSLGDALTGPLQLRMSLWSRYDVKNDDILSSGALNTTSPYYGGFQTSFVVSDSEIMSIAGRGGLYSIYLPGIDGFPEDLDSNSAYLQVEVMETPGGEDTDYVLYDFINDAPDQIITRLQIFERTSTISFDPGQGTYFDSFEIDNNDDATTEISLIFGRVLQERLTWDIANDYFFLSDALVVDGNVNVQGDTLRLDSDNAGAGADVEIVAEQGSDPDGVLRYNSTLDYWELSNNGVDFDEIATFTRVNLDDAYNNFDINPSTIVVDGAQGQTGGLTFQGSLSADETVTITNSGDGGGLMVENTGTGTSLRVNDETADATPFVIDATGRVGVGTATPGVDLHLRDATSSVVNEWVIFDDGTNQLSFLTGTQDPTLVATDADSGSFFFHTENGFYYLKQDDGATTNWNKLGLTADVNDALLGTFGDPSLTNKFVTDSDPRLAATSGEFGETALGTRLDYLGTKKISRSVIFYTRIFLPSDSEVSSVGVFTTQALSGNINMGLYSDVGGAPSSRLIETGTQSGTSPVNTFWEYDFPSPYEVTEAGIYWLAVAVNVQPFARTYNAAEDIFISYRVQPKTNGSTTLPATASPSPLGNTVDLPYFAAFE